MFPVARIYESGNQEVEIIVASLIMFPCVSTAEFMLLFSLLLRETLLLGTMIGATDYSYNLIICVPSTSGQAGREETWILIQTCYIIDPEYYECCFT